MGRDHEPFVCNAANDTDFLSTKTNLNSFCLSESVPHRQRKKYFLLCVKCILLMKAQAFLKWIRLSVNRSLVQPIQAVRAISPSGTPDRQLAGSI